MNYLLVVQVFVRTPVEDCQVLQSVWPRKDIEMISKEPRGARAGPPERCPKRVVEMFLAIG